MESFTPPPGATRVLRTPFPDGSTHTTWLLNGSWYAHRSTPTKQLATRTNNQQPIVNVPEVKPLALNGEEQREELEEEGPQQVRDRLTELTEEWARPLQGVEPLSPPRTI